MESTKRFIKNAINHPRILFGLLAAIAIAVIIIIVVVTRKSKFTRVPYYHQPANEYVEPTKEVSDLMFQQEDIAPDTSGNTPETPGFWENVTSDVKLSSDLVPTPNVDLTPTIAPDTVPTDELGQHAINNGGLIYADTTPESLIKVEGGDYSALLPK